MLKGWDGQFTILMRKRIARHIESCHTCEQERRRMVNPVALMGAAPVFIPAPSFLRDRTLHEIQLTCSGTDMTSTAPPVQRTIATPVDRTPQATGHHAGYEDADDDERRKRKLVLLIGLFAGIPLAVLVLTISWVYLPDREVRPERSDAACAAIPQPRTCRPSDRGGSAERSATRWTHGKPPAQRAATGSKRRHRSSTTGAGPAAQCLGAHRPPPRNPRRHPYRTCWRRKPQCCPTSLRLLRARQHRPCPTCWRRNRQCLTP